MTYKYLLSIIIPTRNRQKYALTTIMQVYNVTDERVQIIISDNSDDDSLYKEVENKKFNERVKYKYIKERIPGVDNYISGITMSDGEYLCNIGDDDGVMRYITDIVEWAKNCEIKAITPKLINTYYYPGVYDEFPNGKLVFVEKINNRTFSIESPIEGLKNVIKQGRFSSNSEKVAKMYHAVVKKECFEKVNSLTGKYCGGLVPDIYLSTAFSLIIDEVMFLEIPLTLPGGCPASETGKTAKKVDYGEVKDFSYWCGQDYTWSSRVPYFYCPYTIWADSLMHALEDMGAYEMMDMFDLKNFTSFCIELYPAYKKRLKQFYYKNSSNGRLVFYKAHFLLFTSQITRFFYSSLWKIGSKLPKNIKWIVKKVLGMKIYDTKTHDFNENLSEKLSKKETDNELYALQEPIETSNIIEAEKVVYGMIKEDVYKYFNWIKEAV